MVSTTSNDEEIVEPVIGLRALAATIWRKRRVWLITGIVGLVVVASLHLVIPRSYTAETDLYLTVPSGSNAVDVMAGNVSLLETQVVAEKAISLGHLDMTPHSLLSKYSGLAVSDNIMSIKFTGSSPEEAVAGAKAVGNAFLAVQANELGLQTNALVRGLRSQIGSLNTEVNTLDSQINNLSSAGTELTTQLANLINQRSENEASVSQLQTQVQQALLNEQSTDHSNSILDPAALVPVSTKKVYIEDGLTGLVAGIAVGMAFVIFRALLTDRPIDRATAATTLGAPVELSLERYRSPHLLRNRRLRRQLRNPSPSLRMIERRLRGHLESAPGSALAVVTVGNPEAAALAMGALAFDLSSEGHRVMVVDAAEHRPLASIVGITPKTGTLETFQLDTGEGPPLRVLVAPDDPIRMAQKPPPDDTDALLVLVTVDAAFGAEQITPWVTDAVLVLSSGGVTLTRMDVTRDMLREAGISLRSVILLDADPQDESSGALGSADLRLTPPEVETAETSV